MDSKLNKLKNYLSSLESLAVAFSGGVDSTFLLKVAHETLGDNVIAITAKSIAFPDWEYEEAAEFTKNEEIRHLILETDELQMEALKNNDSDRCYYCKKAIFSGVIKLAESYGITNIADGSNVDDVSDYRPGKRAIKELKVLSPLLEAGLTKSDIRQISLKMGLKVWNKPPYACLATRFPYGEEITAQKLKQVELAEDYLHGIGFRQVRVRYHGSVARIEVPKEDRKKFFDLKLMDEVYNKLKDLGFNYTSLDLSGYRTGAMNETLEMQNNI